MIHRVAAWRRGEKISLDVPRIVKRAKRGVKIEALALERAIPLMLHLLRASNVLKDWKGLE